MIVTGIYKNKRNFDVYLEHEYAFTVSDEGLYRLKLARGKDFVPDSDTNLILQEDEAVRCKARTASIVSVSSKSEKVLRERLKSEAFSEQAIEKAICFAYEYALIDDRELAREIAVRENRKHRSKRQIAQKLYEKGISSEQRALTMEELEMDEQQNALYAAQKKYRLLRHKPKEEIVKKIRYTLGYQGFSYSAIQYAMRNMVEQIDAEESAGESEYEEI